MRRLFLTAALAAGLWAAPADARQTGAAAERARQLAEQMSKKKHAVREKKGVRVEKFKEIRSEPAVRSDPREYAGDYEADMGFRLSLTVGAGGRVEGSGADTSFAGGRRARAFTLRDARVEGALLTGTKVFDDGSTERLEGVFINRTDRNGPQDPGTTAFGLGVVYEPPLPREEGYAVNKLFYTRKP
jgi:hypothetical protein